jgi:hypothetical protein
MTEKHSVDPNLPDQLHLLDSMPERDPQAIAQGRAKFLSHAQSLTAAVSDQPNQRHNTWIQSIFTKKESKFMFTAITSFIVALTLAFGGAGATVYAAQDSLPNDFLYPVKTFSEDLQLAFLNDDLDQLTMLGTFTQRRWGEINAMLNKGEVVPPETITRLEYQIASMFALAAGMEDSEMQGALEQIRTMLQQGDRTFMSTMGGDQNTEQNLEVLAGATEMLRNQQRLVDSALEDPNTFRQHMDSADNHPGEYPDKIPGGGSEENGAQGATGNGQQGDGICDSPGECVCEDPDTIPGDIDCILIPVGDGNGSGGSSNGGNGSGGSGGNSP